MSAIAADFLTCSLIALVLESATAANAQTPQNPIPIPQQTNVKAAPEEFIGNQATPQPAITTTNAPQPPFMAANGKNNAHNDVYMSDTYKLGGPLGKNAKVASSYLAQQPDPFADCITMSFDSAGRIVTLCPGTSTVRLFLVDPKTLVPLALLDLPPKAPGDTALNGSYFFLDYQDRAIIPTTNRQIWVVKQSAEPAGTSFTVQRIYDLAGVVPENDNLVSVLPDFSGRYWFATKKGLVGTMDPASGTVIGIRGLGGEEIQQSVAVDETGGIFIASDHAMYRFDATADGRPEISWRETYDRGTRIKPGQFSQGTGTTPTLMGKDYVTIADNADPQMHVLVYQRGRTANGARLVCSEAVFKAGSSGTANSLIATDKSIIVENNYGYRDEAATRNGTTTAPGIARIDLVPGGGCRTVWTNEEVFIPSAISKMTLTNGLIYTYTKPQRIDGTDAWYFTTIDFQSGKTVFSRLAGTGAGYNNHYAGLYLGPDGKTAYVGTLGGIVSMQDQE